MSTVTLVLPYPISTNRYWRSFVPRGGSRAIVVVSDEAKAYKAEVAELARAAGVRKPLEGRAAVRIRLFPARPQDWARRARKAPDTWDDTVQCIDLGNAEKVLSDALNGIAWVDDKQLRRIVLERCEPDELGARVVVEISPVATQPSTPSLFGEAAA